MDVRLPRLAYIAVAAILSGIALPYGYWHWLETRTFLAVDMPVSLSRGHLKTSDFSVNLEGWYQITADVDSGFSGCQSGVSHLALDTRSTIYSDGQPIEHSEGVDQYLGHFYGTKKARYSVDLQVLNDSRLVSTRDIPESWFGLNLAAMSLCTARYKSLRQ